MDLKTALAGGGQPVAEVEIAVAEPGTDANPSAVEAISRPGAAPPTLDDVTAVPLGGLAAAGVDLAKLTMAMISGALLILILLLIGAENAGADSAKEVNKQLLTYVVSGAAQGPDPRAAPAVEAFRHAARDSSWAMPAAELATATDLIRQALENPTISAAQREALQDKCIPLPAPDAAGRESILGACASTLQTIFADSGSLAQRASFIQAAQKAMAEGEAARRAFWMQVAQLVLINLLLPILTGLLGYIFGTQQAKKE